MTNDEIAARVERAREYRNHALVHKQQAGNFKSAGDYKSACVELECSVTLLLDAFGFLHQAHQTDPRSK